MSVYFKFKSAKDFNSIPIEGQFISIGTLKERIFELKHLGRGTDFDLVVSNAQSEEEYTDEAAMIPKNTSVLIRRVPGRPRKPILAQPDEVNAEEDNNTNAQNITPPANNFVNEPYTMNVESEWDEFGNDPYASIPEGRQTQSFNPVFDDNNNKIDDNNKIDEESKIRALVETPALDWSSQGDGFRGGRGFGRGGRMLAGRGFGRGGGGFENRTPPPGYVCHRCKVAGHFIQHCPTNGDPTFDVKRSKPPTGIPKSMLMSNPEGSYTLPSGAVAVLQPNEAAFDKEMEGMPTTSRASKITSENIPGNLLCPLCKEAMKDAVLSSKCCFTSFCDQCIRDYIMKESRCVCGAANVLADHLIPNMTLRANIREILETATTSSNDNAGSLALVQDMQSVVPQAQRSPVASAGSKEESKGGPPVMDKSPELAGGVIKGGAGGENLNLTPESRNGKEVEKSPKNFKENLDNNNNINNNNKPSIADPAKKKKKKKVRANGEEMQWRGENNMVDGFGGMPPQMGFNPYFGPVMGMDPYSMHAAGGPPFGGPMPHFMGMPPVPNPFMPPVPPDHFLGQPPFMMPPHRDLAELAMGNVGMNAMNMGPPPGMRWDESFGPRRPDVRRKKEPEMYNERERREASRDREGRRERIIRDDRRVRESSREKETWRKERREESSRDVNHKHRVSSSSSQTEKERQTSKPLSRDSARHSRDSPRRPKRRSSDLDDAPSPPATTAAASGEPPSKKQKGSVFSRISFPDGTSKKVKMDGGPPPVVKKSRGRDGVAAAVVEEKARHARRTGSYDDEEDDESSDEDRHFKRRSSRRKEKLLEEEEEEEERRDNRRSKDHRYPSSSSSRQHRV